MFMFSTYRYTRTALNFKISGSLRVFRGSLELREAVTRDP